MDIFVSLPFRPGFEVVFQTINNVANRQRLRAYRVDQDHMAEPIAQAIEKKIRESRIIIADLTDNNPNVLNEIGQAQTLGKPLILISQESPVNAPFNVRGLRIHKYDQQDLTGLSNFLEQALSSATSPNERLRTMLVPSSLGHPTKESRFVIVASPLSYRRARGQSGGYREFRPTSSDYVGVRGILQAFGLLYGFETLPDIVDPEDCEDDVIREPMSLYSIASPKVNRWTDKLLEQYHNDKRFVPKLGFKADSEASKDLRNVKISLYSDNAILCPPGWRLNEDRDRYLKDFGLIVRGPNPYHQNQMMAIMAGRSSLGTEAACRAFTDSEKIDEIRKRLSGMDIDLENHEQAFYAIVSMSRTTDQKQLPDINTLRVHQVERFHS